MKFLLRTQPDHLWSHLYVFTSAEVEKSTSELLNANCRYSAEGRATTTVAWPFSTSGSSSWRLGRAGGAGGGWFSGSTSSEKSPSPASTSRNGRHIPSLAARNIPHCIYTTLIQYGPSELRRIVFWSTNHARTRSDLKHLLLLADTERYSAEI